MSDTQAIRWRGSTDPVVVSAAGRRAQRLTAAAALGLIAVVLLVWFGWLVRQPLKLPRPHFVFLSGNGSDLQTTHVRFAATPYAQQDLAAWQTLATDFGGDEQPLLTTAADWRTREDLRFLGQNLRGTASQSRDLVLVYLTAHGFVEEGTAYLRWRFGDDNPRTDRIRFQELVAQLADCKAGAKVLFLDAGGWPVEARGHLQINQFPRVAQQELARIDDPHLWVLMSHSESEVSHLSATLQRSLFGYFVEQGLAGAADLNHDRAIDLREMSQYVRRTVADTLQQWSAGAETQTPVLLRAGRQPVVLDDLPLLLPVVPAPTSSQVAGQEKSAGGSAAKKPAATTPQAAPAQKPASPGSRSQTKTSTAPAAGGTAPVPTQPASAGAAPQPASASPAATSTSGTAPATTGSDSQKGSGSAAAPAQNSTPTPAGKGGASGAAAAVSTTAPRTPWELAWSVRDAGWNLPVSQPRIVDRAPHLWREFEIRLVDWEQSTDLAARVLESQWPEELQENTQDLQELINLGFGSADELVPRSDLGRRLARWAKTTPPAVQSGSLALDDLIHRIDASAISEETLQWEAAFHAAVAGDSPTNLQAWLSKSPADADRCCEVRLARQLLNLTMPAPWPLIQTTVQTRIRGERIAVAQLGLTPWIQPDVATGDEYRLAAERLLLDEIHPQRFTHAADLLRRSAQAYARAEQNAAFVAQVMRVRNNVLYHCTDYVRWWFLSQVRQSTAGPSADELLTLFQNLATVNTWIERRQPDGLEEIQQTLHRVYAQDAALQAVAQQSPVATDHFGPQYPGGVTALSILDATALPAAHLRRELDQLAPALHRHRWEIIRLDTSAIAEAPIEARQPIWDRLSIPDLMRLQAGLANLAAINAHGADRQLAALSTAADRAAALSSSESNPAQIESKLLDAYNRFQAEFERYIWTRVSDLAKTIRRDISNAALDPTKGLQRFAAAQRVLLIAHPIDLQDLEGAEFPAAVDAATWYQLLSWLRQRLLTAAEGAPSDEVHYLLSTARRYEAAAQSIPGQMAMSVPPQSPVRVSLPTDVSLILNESQSATIELQNLTSKVVDTWVILDYDADVLSVETSADFRAILQPDADVELPKNGPVISPQSASDGEDPPTLPLFVAIDSQLLQRARPTLQLAPGQVQTLSVRLHRRAPLAASTRLIAKAVAADGISRADLPVRLPSPAPVELSVTGRPNSWTPWPDGVDLHPFPNRRTDYSFSLVNASNTERKLHVELVTPPAQWPRSLQIPVDAMPTTLARQWLSQWGSVAAMPGMSTDLTLPAQGAAPLVFSSSSSAAAPAASPAAATASPPATGNLQSGGLLLITDTSADTLTIRRIDVTPQHPRRYVAPTVSYDAGLEEIRIAVRAAGPDVLPDGPISLRAEFVDPLPPGSNMRLSGQLTTPDQTVVLTADAPMGRQTRSLWLSIDDYPRAFLFDVPCDATRTDLPESHNPLSAKIHAPAVNAAFPGSTVSVPVQLQVDVPAGTLQNSRSQIELGLDLNRNRILDDDDTIIELPSDRQIEVTLSGVAKGGVWSLQTKADDLTAALPLQGFQDGRRDLLVQLASGDREAWSAPVEIVIDNSPPQIVSVATAPPESGTVNEPLQVLAVVDDQHLSGVTQVQVALDVDRNGQLPKSPPPVAAVRDESGRWIATLPTKGVIPGTYALLVQATDAVGNVRNDSRTRFRVLSEAEAAALEAAITGTISGTVFYGRAPQAGIKVELLKDAKDPKSGVATATTDSQGQFQLTKVPQGKYHVQAQGVVRNKRREAGADVAVDKTLELNHVLNLELP